MNIEAKNEWLIQIPLLSDLINEIKLLREKIELLENKMIPQKKYYSLKEACTLKGINYGSTSSSKNRKYQPNRGIPDCYAGGGRRWKHETICEWLKKGDD